MSVPTGPAVLMQLRIVAAALIAGPLLILVAMTFVLEPTAGGGVPWLLIGVVVLVGLGCAAALAALGYRLTPLSADVADVGERSRTAFTTALYRRFGLAYVVVPLSVGLAFVTATGGIFVLVVGVVIGVALIAYYVWPSERTISRSEQALESGGVRSGLREALGTTPQPPGFLA